MGQGTGNVSLEAKMLQQLKEMSEEILYELFLNLWKAYDALYRDRYLDILVWYKIGLRKERVVWIYWVNLLLLD